MYQKWGHLVEHARGFFTGCKFISLSLSRTKTQGRGSNLHLPSVPSTLVPRWGYEIACRTEGKITAEMDQYIRGSLYIISSQIFDVT